jgi:DNA-directed RNA polymerase subunit RPC12/RpoP
MELDEYPCGYCDHKFKDENRMIKHIKDKHDDDNDEDLSDLEEDEIIEDPNPNFDVVYKANPELNSSSSLIESFACHPCGLNFESEEALSDHITDKHDIDDNDTKKMFSCSSCDKTFRVKSRLKNHAEIHLETSQRQRPYPCQSCDKTFFRSADLWAHEKIHSGSKYTCQLCGKKLASSGSLHNHRKSVHESVKNFECHVCRKRFALKQKLVNHVMKEHENRKPFQCDQCDKGFIHKQSYEAHQRSHNGTAIHCQLCSKPFRDVGYLNKHVKWHSKVQAATAKRKNKSSFYNYYFVVVLVVVQNYNG